MDAVEAEVSRLRLSRRLRFCSAILRASSKPCRRRKEAVRVRGRAPPPPPPLLHPEDGVPGVEPPGGGVRGEGGGERSGDNGNGGCWE